MPFTTKSFQTKKKGMSLSQAKRGASIANGIMRSCLKDGKSQATCDRISIATALKSITRGGRRVTK